MREQHAHVYTNNSNTQLIKDDILMRHTIVIWSWYAITVNICEIPC